VDEFIFTVTNTGDLGADTFDMDVTTSPMGMGWSVTLHDAASGVPLTDTDSDGKVDTGPIAIAASRRVLARVSAPVGLAVGARNTTYVDVTSSRNTAKTKMVTIDSTVPAPFAQTVRDQTTTKLSSDLNWPTKQMEVEVFDEGWNGNQPAIVETLNNRFVHVWTDYQWSDDTPDGWVLRYAVTDKYGAIIKAATNLTNPPADSNYSSDISEPALAVAGDGRIGVIWTKRLYYSPDGTYNMNVYFAILNTSGGIVQAPVNLTNITAYGSYSNSNQINFYYPGISASSARFFLTWEIYSQATGKEDVHYAVRQSTGAEVVAPTALTASVAGSSYYREPKQIQLTDNRFMVIYYHQYFNGQYYYQDELFKVLNSSGAVLTQETDWGSGSQRMAFRCPAAISF